MQEGEACRWRSLKERRAYVSGGKQSVGCGRIWSGSWWSCWWLNEQRRVKNKERNVKFIYDNVDDDYIITTLGNLV